MAEPRSIPPEYKSYLGKARSVRGEARRRAIIAAATDAFVRRGFHGASMDEIGAEVGVTGPALYYHFTGKEQLLAAIFFEIGDEIFESLDHGLKSADDPEGRLRALIDCYVQVVLANRRRYTLIYTEERHLLPEDRVRSHARRVFFYELWSQVIGDYRSDCTPTECTLLAASAAWSIHSLVFADSDAHIEASDEELRHVLPSAAFALVEGYRCGTGA
jgi:AcrR family transcriptional regulator